MREAFIVVYKRKRQLLADLLKVLIELPAKLQSAIDNFFATLSTRF